MQVGDDLIDQCEYGVVVGVEDGCVIGVDMDGGCVGYVLCDFCFWYFVVVVVGGEGGCV